MSQIVLGISGNFYRGSADGAAVLVRDGELIAGAEEERFIRIKHAPSQLPEEAIRFCLKKAGVSIGDVDVLAFPQTTWRQLDRNLPEFFEFRFGGRPKAIEYVDHHLSHAASAYRVSGFDEAMILTADWSGDGVALTLGHGRHGEIKQLKRFGPPRHSLGIYYALVTQFLGFHKWEDEYKVMGLASYGKPTMDFSWLLPDCDEEPGFYLDERYINETVLQKYPALHGIQQPCFGEEMIKRLGPSRVPGAPITDRHKDIAASAQYRLEEVVSRLVRQLHRETGSRNLCIAGGVGLNCSMNGALLGLDCVENLFVPPVASDAGIALGAALEVAARSGFTIPTLEHASWGPEYGNDEIQRILERSKFAFRRSDDIESEVARALADNKIVGWFQGRMEFGPRALGNRSILADPRQPDMRDRINYYVKYREDFRPLAPSMLAEAAPDYIEQAHPCPFMTMTFTVREDKRSVIPAVTHVDGTCRAQTVTETANPKYYRLIKRFGELTGVPIVLNTSLNVKGDPIAMKPEDAIATFFSTGLDVLAVGDFIVVKG
jgi:carbamoyltransferase